MTEKESRLKAQAVMGEKAARARHQHDESTAKFFHDQHMREVFLFPEWRDEMQAAYRDAYRAESASYC